MTDHVAYPGCYCADCVEGNPSARITGDKDRENPVEGAPYGEGLIDRITELERQLKVAREALVDVTHFADRNGVDIARAALADMEQADAD